MKKVLIDLLKSYKWKILISLIVLGIDIYLLTYPPMIVGKIIDMLYNLDENKQTILNYTYYLLGVCVVLLVVRLAWKWLLVEICRGSESRLRKNLFKRFLKLKLKDVQNIKNGEIMAYFVKDTTEIRRCMNAVIFNGGRVVFTFIFASFQMIRGANFYLTAAVMAPILVGMYIVTKIKKYVEISFKKSQVLFTEMSEYIQESTDGIRTTKAYSCEGKQLKDFIRKNRKVRDSNNIVDVYSNLLKMSLTMCFGICYRG